MSRSRQDWVAFLAGLTPAYGFRWPSEVEGELGVPVDLLAFPRSHPDLRWLYAVVVLMWVSAGVFVVVGTVVPLWCLVALSGVLTVRATVRTRVAKDRCRRLAAQIEERRKGLL